MTAQNVPQGVRMSPELKERLREIKRRSAVIQYQLLGRPSGRGAMYAGWSAEDVLLKGTALAEAEIAAAWTPEHEAMLKSLPVLATQRAARGERVSPAEADAILAEAREQGFGPATPRDAKFAKAVELHDARVPDTRIGELFGVTGARVNQWRTRAAEAELRGEDRLIREAQKLYGEGVEVAEIGKRLGVARQQAARWCHNAPAAPSPDRKARARSRSAGNGAVKHATPVTFLAPEAKP